MASRTTSTTVDGQTLLLAYPSIVTACDAYVRPVVWIESGAKSALDPHVAPTVEPCVAADMSAPGLSVDNVTTIEPIRTFWDKVIILHGTCRWFEHRGELRQEGRVTRHYYDVHRLLGADVGRSAVADRSLAAECVRHARMFFDRPDLDLAQAAPGTYALAPSPAMRDRLARDYENMAAMIFGPIPTFEDVMDSVVELERQLND